MTLRNNTNCMHSQYVVGISWKKPQSREYDCCAIKLIEKFRYTVPFHFLFRFIYLNTNVYTG